MSTLTHIHDMVLRSWGYDGTLDSARVMAIKRDWYVSYVPMEQWLVLSAVYIRAINTYIQTKVILCSSYAPCKVKHICWALSCVNSLESWLWDFINSRINKRPSIYWLFPPLHHCFFWKRVHGWARKRTETRSKIESYYVPTYKKTLST